MSTQKHDVGHQKRQQATTKRVQSSEIAKGETLARNLVSRGLCTPLILELPYKPPRE